jgi:predicted signal transduction protein with EAL and GGDEF domain
MRPGDTVARMGGDEFTILLEDLQDAGDAGGAAERVLRALEAPFLIAGREVFTTTSIGIAVAGGGDGPLDPHALLRDADTAMYQAKAAGRGRYLCFDPGMNTRAVDRLELETDLRAALEQGAGLLLHFQPIVSLRSGRIQEVEALVRWDHPGRGLIPPGKFIPLAEETGLIVPLGEWVLREACRQAGAWPRSAAGGAAPPGVSVNLSARQLQQPDLVDVVARVLCETGLEPARLQLEITESVMMQEPAATIGRLHRLKGLGVRLAVDDFGTGYSSMAYLSVLPIDTIKIDRSFVLRLGQQAEDSAIIRAIVSLARSLNLRVTSEGIETVAQLAALVALGSDVGQGYYLSAPVDAPAAAALLAAPDPFASQLRAADALADAAPALPVRRAA